MDACTIRFVKRKIAGIPIMIPYLPLKKPLESPAPLPYTPANLFANLRL